ncbi:MAG: hypothetical protein HY231_10865 [Acidobacteria bacterium]|nr:hypothetical protein [Acidobacteriota bacterium]
MNKKMIWILPLVLCVLVQQAAAQDPVPTEKPRVVRPPAPKPLIEIVKQYAVLVGATIDDAKSTATMIVSNHPDSKGNKTNVVILHDRKKNFLGFYIYNFGSVKDLQNREEVFKYLLSINDAITIGSFFVDTDQDIGYKYLTSTAQSLNQKAFEAIYLTMIAVAREHKPEIRKLLSANKEEKPPQARKVTEEKPPLR